MPIKKKTVLIAPLNWGLGHSTRCIPIIQALLDRGFEVIIASDGVALNLLKKEFPELKAYELPSYHISYAKNPRFFKIKLLLNSPKILGAMRKERKVIKQIARKVAADVLISDNRLGVYVKGLFNVFITHQLRVMSGNTTQISSLLHQQIFKKYDAVWVPDFRDEPNLTGALGHLKKSPPHLTYIGPLSRFEKEPTQIERDLLVLLSGPEPQRSILEKKICSELENFPGRVLMVQGVIEEAQKSEHMDAEGRFTRINFMQSKELSKAIQSSKMVLCRSGYTTVMDLAKLGKKAFFIPTPGQYEQEYLAEMLDKQGLVPACSQEAFKLSELDRISSYAGLEVFEDSVDFDSIFSTF